MDFPPSVDLSLLHNFSDKIHDPLNIVEEIDSVIDEAVDRRASDIHFEPALGHTAERSASQIAAQAALGRPGLVEAGIDDLRILQQD